jgi:hypothetical protein
LPEAEVFAEQIARDEDFAPQQVPSSEAGPQAETEPWDDLLSLDFSALEHVADVTQESAGEFYDELPVFHGRPVKRDPTSIDPIDDSADCLVIDELATDDFIVTNELGEDSIADNPSPASLRGGRPHRGPCARG